MIILITGATGFIGSRLANALAAKHEVICTARNPSVNDPRFRYIQADFAQDFDQAVWLPRLQNVDVVINGVGILRERGEQTFEALHVKAPEALFSACVQANVKRIVQISALGADEHATSQYHLSKKTADDFLFGLPIPSVVVQPSLVYGAGGASARLFLTLASLPVIPLPGDGAQQVQPIHVDDLVSAIVALIETDEYRGQRLLLVGPEPLSLRDFLARLRNGIRLPKAKFLPMPLRFVRMAAKFGNLLPGSLLDQETLQMLERGNVADSQPTHNLLGRDSRTVNDFVDAENISALRTQAKLNWLAPLLRVSLAIVWIVTGLLSLGVYPIADSYALLARVGVVGSAAPIMLYGAAVLDLALGVAILIAPRRALWLAQFILITGYTAIITWKLPEFWLHPYGPILKNLPLLAVIWLLYELEER